MNNHIVYVGYLDGTCVYVGEGKPNRYKHLNSGVSHVYEANAAHHRGKYIDTKVVHSGLTKQESLGVEGKLIIELKPLWNKTNNFNSGISFSSIVETEIIRVFGKNKMESKQKKSQIEALRYIGSLLDSSGTSRFSCQQTMSVLGDPRVGHSFCDPKQWLESKEIFDFIKIKSGVWEAKLKCVQE